MNCTAQDNTVTRAIELPCNHALDYPFQTAKLSGCDELSVQQFDTESHDSHNLFIINCFSHNTRINLHADILLIPNCLHVSGTFQIDTPTLASSIIQTPLTT